MRIFFIVLGLAFGFSLDAQTQRHFPVDQSRDYINHARTLRNHILSDPYRPIYHFVAPEGRAYPFDPNGAIYWDGKYHVGFIYQSLLNGEREHFWGHAVSTDLLHWSLYPDMLDVKEGDIEKGIFSGGAFLSKEGVPHIMYHGYGADANLVAYSTDEDLRVWKKFEGNPVLRSPKEGDPMFGKYRAWDPEGWYDKDTDYYYQISGGDTAGFFRSRDMTEWEYLGNFIDQQKRYRHHFEDLSCPDFFSLGSKHMLLFISHNLGSQYYVGDWSAGRFTVEQHGRMNWPGGTFFAPEQLVDDQGRNLIWGWVLDRNPDVYDFAAHWNDEETNPSRFAKEGWSGVMSMPRVVALSEEGEVLITPPEEFEKLRLKEWDGGAFSLGAGQEKELGMRGKSVEIEVEMTLGSSHAGLKVFGAPEGDEETLVFYDTSTEELVIHFARSRASAGGLVEMPPNCMFEPQLEGFTEPVSEQRAPFKLQEGENLHLNIFLDRSIIEVFANERLCMTQVVYPELPDSDRIRIYSGGEDIEVKSLKVWKMAQTNMY